MSSPVDATKPFEVKCWWAPAPGAPLVPSTITRRALSPDDVLIHIRYAGICHSDIHQARDEWSDEWGCGIFPMVPGHEIVGDIVAVGENVSKFAVGQRAGVGCLVDSCRGCGSCSSGEEQYCSNGMVGTYGSRFRHKHCAEWNEEGGNVTYGGYSQYVVVDQAYTLSVSDRLPFHAVAPLLCAGITVYSPMRYYGLQPSQRFAVAGIGGLGHMAVKIGKAMGCHTTVISRGTGKRESCLNELKADEYLDASDVKAMRKARGGFDFILSTIAATHDMGLYIDLLGTNGKLIMVGVPSGKLPLAMHGIVSGRKTLAGSMIGGIRETQEMLDFCAEHGIVSDVEVISASQINEAYERALRSDVKYRFVIDTATL